MSQNYALLNIISKSALFKSIFMGAMVYKGPISGAQALETVKLKRYYLLVLFYNILHSAIVAIYLCTVYSLSNNIYFVLFAAFRMTAMLYCLQQL